MLDKQVTTEFNYNYVDVKFLCPVNLEDFCDVLSALENSLNKSALLMGGKKDLLTYKINIYSFVRQKLK